MNTHHRVLVTLVLTLGLGMAAGSPALAQPLDEDEIEPHIVIREEEDRTIREYRVAGQLYAIEIQPSLGPSYFLVDHDGDGNFERQQGDRIAVPQWVLLSR
ncbi:DUF2782 domain-containing protein [Halomonas campisalis]|uniref:DUF2782 domain-containing protein n=1 Tax=Billgrantia campisalis TaxID=74661 RepID=A0ABS9PF97_9GAMM|nr:DUF2782 domain-containing protein [Halomonas campisalis]MCG6659805.1 DUF2782 domain-containing protein [Halomonas campisalis]MDR5865005.1 DUF2782 domain-containing protein [Halomonas campisalis]